MESEAAKIGIQIVEGSLEDKPPTKWKMEKQGWEEAEKSKEEERRSEKRKSQKKEDPGGPKGWKVENTLFFQCFVAPEGRKVGSLKHPVRSHPGRLEIKKLHAVVAGNAFWVILRSECQKHLMFRYNYNYIYTTLHCPTLHYTTTTTTATAKTAATLPLHDTTLHCATLVTLQYTRPTVHYTALHYATLITLHCTTTTQHITTLQLQLHYTTATTTVTTLRYTALHCTTLHPAVVGEVTTATTPKSTPSVDLLCHPCITTTHLFYSFLSLKLPPPPCAVLLAYNVYRQRSPK